MINFTTNDIKVLYAPEELQNEIAKLGQKLNELYKNEEVVMVCALKGAAMFMADLAKHLKMPVKMEFIRLSSYGSGTTSSGKVKAVDLSLPDLTGKNVLIAEDIVDTGLTAKFLTDYINNNFKVKSFKFCSLLNKKLKRQIEIEPDYYIFDIDDKFVVGYGLDYDGYFRNLPFIGYIE